MKKRQIKSIKPNIVFLGIPFDAVAQENLSPDVLPEKYSLLSKT